MLRNAVIKLEPLVLYLHKKQKNSTLALHKKSNHFRKKCALSALRNKLQKCTNYKKKKKEEEEKNVLFNDCIIYSSIYVGFKYRTVYPLFHLPSVVPNSTQPCFVNIINSCELHLFIIEVSIFIATRIHRIRMVKEYLWGSFTLSLRLYSHQSVLCCILH